MHKVQVDVVEAESIKALVEARLGSGNHSHFSFKSRIPYSVINGGRRRRLSSKAWGEDRHGRAKLLTISPPKTHIALGQIAVCVLLTEVQLPVPSARFKATATAGVLGTLTIRAIQKDESSGRIGDFYCSSIPSSVQIPHGNALDHLIFVQAVETALSAITALFHPPKWRLRG